LYHSVTFGDKNTWDDWRLVPASRPVFNPPAQKVKTLEIPGGDGVIDLSQSLTGYPVYQNRTGSIEFIVMNDFIQNYNSDIYPQEPEELPAQWGFYWSDDPKKPLPFVAMSTSPYMTGNCCTHNGHVWQSGQDNNVWEPGTVNVKWTDLGSIEEVMDN
jgi:hypothetical protein